MMKEQNGIKNIEWTSTNQIVFTPRVDLAKVGTLKVDIYDATAGSAKRVLFATEDWKVEQPILEFSAIVDLKYNNPALATNDQIKIIDLINALGAADKKKWTELTLKDAVKNVLVKYNATTIAAEETIAETLYRKMLPVMLLLKLQDWKFLWMRMKKTLLMMQLLQLLLGRELRQVQYILMM